MAVIAAILLQALQIALVLAVAPAVTGLVRKIKARLLGRRGAPIHQPYLDLLRLMRKEPVVAEGASPLFTHWPTVILAVTWLAAALVPTISTDLAFAPAADLIVLIGLLATARFATALAGLDVGTAFGGIGASREMMIATLAEPAMLMIVFSLSITVGTTLLPALSALLITEPVGLRVSLGLALIALLIVGLAENGRIPVDNPATHLELTMVHEAMVLEYSGRHLAFIEAAAHLKLLLTLSLIAAAFFPFGMALPGEGPLAVLGGLAAWLAKLAVGAAGLAAIETRIAKMRLFRVGELIGGALLIGLIAVILLFVSRSF
jgi:formate hydrogenlyase subunit 4